MTAAAQKPKRWIGECYECHRERELESRYDGHGARTLCDACASKPPRKPRAIVAPVNDRDSGSAIATSDDGCAWLTSALGLDGAGLAVVGANVFGRGPSASVDVRLSDGSKLTFDRFSDLAKPSALAAYVVTCTGVWRQFKGPEAGRIAAAVFRLAEHQADAGADESAAEFGAEFLRIAPVYELALGDQAERWRAFESLSRMSPARDAGEDRSPHALAAASLVLVDRESGDRLVRTGWFASYVKREVGGLYSPAALAVQMQRVGWLRQNTQGRVKATCPTDGRVLSWRFYTVPSEWDDR